MYCRIALKSNYKYKLILKLQIKLYLFTVINIYFIYSFLPKTML